MNNKLLSIAITLTVGVILVGGILMPTIQDAQRTAGDVVTIDNPVVHNSYILGPVTGTDTVTYLLDSGIFYVNGTQVPISHGGTVGTIATSADGYLGIRNNGAAMYFFETTSSGYVSHTISSGTTVTVTASTVSDGTSTWQWSDAWACGVATDDPHVVTFPNNTTDAVLNDVDQVFGWAEVTLSDSTKTVVGFRGLNVDAGDLTATVTAPIAAYPGYTDAITLDGYIITVDGVEVQPQALMPVKIEAHEASGGAYTIYGVIPVIVIVALLLVAIGAVRSKD